MIKMIKLYDNPSIEKINALFKERLEYIAYELEEIGKVRDGVYRLSDEQRRLVLEGLDDLDGGRVVSDADMAAFWDRHRT